MILFPHFSAAVADLSVSKLSKASKVPVDVIRALLAGGLEPGPAERTRLAEALGLPEKTLWRRASVLLDPLDVEPIRDPETLRRIDGPS